MASTITCPRTPSTVCPFNPCDSTRADRCLVVGGIEDVKAKHEKSIKEQGA